MPLAFPAEDLGRRALRIVWHLAAAMALVPAIVGVGWLLRSALRPSGAGAGAFAVLSLATVAALLYVNQTGSYDERYELPAAVPVAVAFAVAAGRRREVRVIPTALAAALVWWPLHRWAGAPPPRHGWRGLRRAR